VRDGLAQQYIWPSLPDPAFVLLITMLMLVFQIKFTTGILDTRQRLPNFHRLFYRTGCNLSCGGRGFNSCLSQMLYPIL